MWQVTERKFQTWLTEQATQAELRMLACHKQVVEAKSDLYLAQLAAQYQIAQAARLAEQEEAELTLDRQVRSSPGTARQILGHQLETEKLLLERERLRHLRLTRNFSTEVVSQNTQSPSPAIEQHLSDQQIEALALRAITRFAQLDPLEADQAWQQWQQELSRRLPAFAAAEVARRAQELRSLSH